MLGHVARFELRFQASTPMFWITSLIFFSLTFWWVVSDSLRVGWGGYVVRNSPYATGLMGLIMSLFGIFILTSFVSNVILRDDETRFGPIIGATRLSKSDYLFGRFLGAFGASCLAFLSVPLGGIAAAAMPWLDPATVGPLRLDAWAYTYLVLCLPTLFILGAGMFALATTTRSMMSTYIAAIALLMVYLFSARFLNQPDVQQWAALFDPFGLSAYKVLTQYWSPTERNTQLAPITGVLLQNRMLWLAVAVALLAWTWKAFSRTELGGAKAPSKKSAAASPASEARAPAITGSAPGAPAARSLGWAPLLALTRFDVLSVLRNPMFLVLLGIALGNSLIALWYAGDNLVTVTLPATRILVNALSAELGLIPLAIAAFYAGELVWRDRERRMHDIVGATPAAEWVFVVPKVIAIAIVLMLMVALGAVAAIGVQAVKGYYTFELGKYLSWYLLPWLVTMTQFAALAVFIQVLVPNKYSGLLVVMLVLAANLALPKLGWEDHLYLFGTTSPVPLSDMNGQGPYAGYAAWYRAYWTAAAIIFALLAYGLWRRGGTATLAQRLRQLPSRLSGGPVLLLSAAVVLMLGTGGVAVYNTRVLNEWGTAIDSERWAAEYEKQLFPYKALTPPRITDVKLDIDIDTDVPRAITRGTFTVENKSAQPIEDLPVFWARRQEKGTWLGTSATPDLQLKSLEIPGAQLVKEIPDLHFRVYRFDSPLQPGQRVEIRFETVREQIGFRNSNNEDRIVENGTFLTSHELTPVFGVHNLFALQDRTARRRYGLPDELRPPKLDDNGPRGNHYFRPDSDWVNADLTISVAADQTIVAPGERIEDSVIGERRTARFKTTAPIHHFFTIQSARYAERKEQWNDVALEVYYHPGHPYNVDRMLRAMRESLEYYSKNFSPYQFKHLRIAEFPAYRDFAQAYPGTIAYGEATGFLNGTPRNYDGVTRVTAHETAHQWWAHQVIGADMQGQTVLTETLAEYSALMVMEKINGPDEIHRFLRASLDSYLRARGSDITGEVPLELVEEQAHIRYTKGGMVMYLLKDQMGEEAVNRALRSLLEDYALKGPPYPTSRDLVRRLRAQAAPELQPLITDLFEKITTYDFKLAQASTRQRADGKWDVVIEIEARKHYADERGGQVEAPLDAVIDIGVFTAEPGTPGFAADSVLYLQHQPVRSGNQTLTVVVDREPKAVGADPYSKYIDISPADNILALPAP